MTSGTRTPTSLGTGQGELMVLFILQMQERRLRKGQPLAQSHATVSRPGPCSRRYYASSLSPISPLTAPGSDQGLGKEGAARGMALPFLRAESLSTKGRKVNQSDILHLNIKRHVLVFVKHCVATALVLNL